MKNYGFLSRDVLAIGQKEGLLEPLVPGLPYLKAEVVYACRYEYLSNLLVQHFLKMLV